MGTDEIITKTVPGYEGLYEIDTLARVWSLNYRKLGRRVELKYRFHLGYRWIGLYKDKKRKITSIHHLMGLAFLSNPENKPCINHIDGDKSNNSLTNLEWNTHKENITHAVKQLGMNCGEKQWKSKLTKEGVLDIFYNQDMSTDDLAIKYDIDRNYVLAIKRKVNWKWLLGAL